MTPPARTSAPRTAARLVLGAFLLFAGAAHLTFARSEFAAQVPGWLPLDADVVVLASGVVELVLGAALVLLGRYRVLVGWVVAVFFIAVFPGNIAQYVDGVSAFGLDSDGARLARLFFQPVLVLWTLWSTAAWRDRRTLRPSSTGVRRNKG
ncbi:DoxX family protein [Arthrobacter sp. MDT2-16]